MAILADRSIKELCTFLYETVDHEPISWDGTTTKDVPGTYINSDGPMIKPFVDHLVRENEQGHKIISYGLTSYGYDVRLQEEIKLFTNINNTIVDPMNPCDSCFTTATIHEDEKGNRYFIIPPNSYALGVTVEYFKIPKNVMVVCLGKSTYARSAILINTTPIEAGFCGQVVIEVGNSSNLPVKVYTGMGIAQFMFFRGNVPCEISYGDRNGKYQGQTGITLSKV